MWAFIAIFVSLPLALCTTSIIHERRELPLEGAIDRQRIEADTLLPMRIGLRQNEKALANAESWLMEIADPDSAKFGQHWSQAQVIQAFQPSDETVKAVKGWLSLHGITRFTHSDNKMWFAFDLAASKAESLLQTEYYEHRNQQNTFEVSCDQYSLPQDLKDHIDYVTPGVKSKDITFRTKRSRDYLLGSTQRRPHSPGGSPHPRPWFPPGPWPSNQPWPSQLPPWPSLPPYPSSSPASSSPQPNPTPSLSTGTSAPRPTTPPYPPNDLEHCHRSVSPACIRVLYNFTVADPSLPVSPNNHMGIYEQWILALQGDLNKFFDYYTDIPWDTSPIYDSIDGAITRPKQTLGWRKNYTGGEGPFIFASESTLDYQYPFGAWKIFNDFLDAIDGSYCTYTAFNETGNYPGVDPHYPDYHPHGWNRPLQCGVYKPTNVISISYGINELWLPANYQKRQCLEYLKLGLQGTSLFASSGDDGVGYCRDRERIFGPSVPASCPWVTSVGATFIQRFKTPYAPEEATHWTGGGFSLLFDRPPYQSDVVSHYFSDYDPGIPYFYNGAYRNNTGRYNRNGRGFPDVAAVGLHIADIADGYYVGAGGTSASSPIFASLINRIIEERIRAGKGPLGFINPTLYKNPEALNDITLGINNAACGAGFPTEPGWDPASGLGTPNYPKLLDVFMNLP